MSAPSQESAGLSKEDLGGRLLDRHDVNGGPIVFDVRLLTWCKLLGYLVAFVNRMWIIVSIWRSSRR